MAGLSSVAARLKRNASRAQFVTLSAGFRIGSPAVDRWMAYSRTILMSAAFVCLTAWVGSARVAAAQCVGGVSPDTHGLSGSIVYGTVRASTGAPAAHVHIEAVGTPDTTTSDSLGCYVLSRLAGGTSGLRITETGYEPLAVRVMVPRAGSVRVDMILSQSVVVLPPAVLPLVRVTTERRAMGVQIPTRIPARTPGVWEWQGDIADAPETSGEPDVFRLLVSDPRAMMRPDGFGGTLVEAATGGVPNRILVDGLPMWNPLHGGPSLGAVNPDVIRDLRVYDGAMSARYGDALFQTVDVETREAALGKPSSGVALGPIAVRGWWGRPFQIGTATGQLLIAGRRTSAEIFPDKSDIGPIADRWQDGLAVLSLRSRRTAIQLLATGSGDNLTADLDDATIGAKTDALLPLRPDASLELPWRSATVGAAWTEQLSPTRQLETRMWDSRLETTTKSSTVDGGTTTSSSARETGLGAELNLSSVRVGASVESFRTSYTAEQPIAGNLMWVEHERTMIDSGSVRRSPYPLRAAPTILAMYAERRWGSVRDHWTATSGIRVTAPWGDAPLIEPRLSASVDLARGMVATVGYASTHQFVQSVRDVGSAAGAIIPISIPVAAGASGVPVAAGQMITAGVSTGVGASARLTVDAYDRHFEGLVVPSPLAVFPAGNGLDVVDGRTIGVATSVQCTGDDLTARMTYGVQRTALSFNSPAYFPPVELAQSATASVEWRATAMTKLRMLSSVGTSFPSASRAPDDEPIGYSADLRDHVVLSGPRTLSDGPVTPYRLPMYMRVDMGAIREWRTGDLGGVSLTVTLANVFDRPNVATFIPGETRGGARAVILTPRSLLAGIAWHQ